MVPRFIILVSIFIYFLNLYFTTINHIGLNKLITHENVIYPFHK